MNFVRNFYIKNVKGQKLLVETNFNNINKKMTPSQAINTEIYTFSVVFLPLKLYFSFGGLCPTGPPKGCCP